MVGGGPVTAHPSCPVKSSAPAREAVLAYNAGVLDGSVVAGRWVFAAAQRFARDLERDDLVMDWASIDRLGAFFEDLTLVGDDSGRAFALHPWQLWTLANLWGWRYAEDGRRRTKLAILQVARGAGEVATAPSVLPLKGWRLASVDSGSGACWSERLLGTKPLPPLQANASKTSNA